MHKHIRTQHSGCTKLPFLKPENFRLPGYNVMQICIMRQRDKKGRVHHQSKIFSSCFFQFRVTLRNWQQDVLLLLDVQLKKILGMAIYLAKFLPYLSEVLVTRRSAEDWVSMGCWQESTFIEMK